MVKVNSITDNGLSFYKTTHDFQRYGEFKTIDEFREYCNWARENNIQTYVLGNGSNTLFVRRKIETLVLKNKLERYITPLNNSQFEVSSSTLVIDVLKYCYKNSLECFYYLASVPATIGGALAMNAGRGWSKNMSIYDFVESVTFFDFSENCIKTLTKEQIVKDYRETIFTGLSSNLILKAVFTFEKTQLNKNPITSRLKWAKKNQDNVSPNCGSVFKKYQPFIIKMVKGLTIAKAHFSKKTDNWIANHSHSSIGVVCLIKVVKFLHLLIGKKAILEVIEVK